MDKYMNGGNEEHKEPADKEKAEKMSHLMRRLEDEITLANQYWDEGYRETWEQNRMYAAGEQYNKLAVYEEKIVTNYVHRNNEAILAELLTQDLDIIVKPRRGQFYEAVNRIKGAALYFWEDKELDLYGRCNEGAKDLVDIGMGVIKTTYLFEDAEVEVEEMVKEDRAMIKQIKKMGKMLKGEGGEPERKVKRKERLVLEDRLLIETIDPFALRVSYGYDGRNGLGGAPMIFQLREWRHEEFKQLVGEERMHLFQAVSLAESRKKKNKRGRASYNCADKNSGLVYRGWEIWKKDKYAENGYVFCIVDERFKEYIKELKSSPYPFGHPFVVARDKTERGEFYPKGRTSYYKDNQDEYNMETSFLMSFAKKALPKFGYDAEHMSERDAQKIANGEELSIIGFENLKGRSLNEVFQLISQANIPREILLARDAARQHIDEVPGVTNTFAGGGIDRQQRATLGVLQDRGSSRRLIKLQEEVDDMIGRVIKNTIVMSQMFLDKGIMISIVGGGADEWEEVSTKQLKGDFVITASVKRPADTQELVNFLTLVNTMPESRTPDAVTGEKINVVRLVKSIVDDSPILRRIPGLIQIAGNPDDENKRMLKGEVVKPRDGEDHALHIAKHVDLLKSKKASELDPQVRKIIETHLEESFTLLQNQLNMQMSSFFGGQGEGKASGGSGAAQPIAPKGIASQAGGMNVPVNGVGTMQDTGSQGGATEEI